MVGSFPSSRQIVLNSMSSERSSMASYSLAVTLQNAGLLRLSITTEKTSPAATAPIRFFFNSETLAVTCDHITHGPWKYSL